jgi:NAD(P)-dependent dehydrogenase (short-subunit alcohol dehydrogenase family)
LQQPNSDTSRLAVVAGGGSGIGRACARQLAAAGWRVIVVGRDAGKLAAAVAQIAEAGGQAEAFPADVRDFERLAELAALVEPDGLDLLINSAGGQFAAPAAELSPNGWRAVVDTNLTGAFYLSRQLFRALRKRRGAVVHVVANLWQRGAAGYAHSAAARAGVVNLTKTLAVEWAEHGVRVNAVSPGMTDTEGLQRYPNREETIARVPLRRAASADEVAEAILFMARAGYVTGEVLTIDGGLQLVS